MEECRASDTHYLYEGMQHGCGMQLRALLHLRCAGCCTARRWRRCWWWRCRPQAHAIRWWRSSQALQHPSCPRSAGSEGCRAAAAALQRRRFSTAAALRFCSVMQASGVACELFYLGTSPHCCRMDCCSHAMCLFTYSQQNAEPVVQPAAQQGTAMFGAR